MFLTVETCGGFSPNFVAGRSMQQVPKAQMLETCSHSSERPLRARLSPLSADSGAAQSRRCQSFVPMAFGNSERPTTGQFACRYRKGPNRALVTTKQRTPGNAEAPGVQTNR
jgi:hypothetical protein